MFDLIIIGGGPAGITAGIYAVRKKMKTLLITKDFIGQIEVASLIENYPGFAEISRIELSQKFENHLKKFDITIIEDNVKKIIKGNKKEFIIQTENKKKYLAKTVIVASGRNFRSLKVPGEKKFIGQGVSYCSVCDAPFFKEKIVAVIGAGNSGLQTVLDLEKYAKRIVIFATPSKIRADEIIQEKLNLVKKEASQASAVLPEIELISGGKQKSKKIEIFLNTEIKEIKGNKKVESIVFKDKTSQKIYEMPIQGVFVKIGHIPNINFIKGLVKFNQKDEIIIDSKTCQTSVAGIFAAGDVTDVKYKQIVIAAGEGSKAALSAYEYLQKH